MRDGGVRRGMCVPDRGYFFTWVYFSFYHAGEVGIVGGVWEGEPSRGRTITTFDPPLIVENPFGLDEIRANRLALLLHEP